MQSFVIFLCLLNTIAFTGLIPIMIIVVIVVVIIIAIIIIIVKIIIITFLCLLDTNATIPTLPQASPALTLGTP